MIDTTKEDLIDLGKELDKLPVKCCRQTVRNWTCRGVRNNSGQLVFLETISIGGRRFTSKQAFQRFCEDCTR